MASPHWSDLFARTRCGLWTARAVATLLVTVTLAQPARAAEAQGPGVQVLVQAQLLEAGETYPERLPQEGAAWQALRLPDNWAGTRPGYAGYLWYRLRFDGPPAGQDTAVYLPGFSVNAQLWVNGVGLGAVGRMREPVSRHMFSPRLAAVPAALLRPGPQANELLVLVVGYRLLRCGLGEVYLGPSDTLQQAHDWRRFWQVTGVQASIVVSLMLGVYVLMLWWRERSNGVFGWFGLAAIVWGLRNLNLVVTDPPWHAALSNLGWSRWFACGEVLFIASFTMFTWRYTAQLDPRAPPSRLAGVAVSGYAACGVLAMLAMPADASSWRFLLPLSAWGLGMTLWSQARLSQAAWHVRRVEPVAIAAAGFLYLLLLAHDTALIADTRQQGLYHLRPYAVLPLFLAIGWLLTRRYLDALDAAQRLSASLHGEVQAQRQALERNFERLRLAEREQAQSQERTRLMRDLHDGLGLHLLSALQQARSASADPRLLTSTLQDCLDDLRVAVDSLAGDERDPAAVLGNLRYRMAPRLAAAGIRLDWEVEGEVPELPWLDAPAVLQLLRIVQEALSNAVRHSGARVVTISLRARAATLEVCVQDDGRHAGITERAGGRGLPSMKARAASLGASFELSGGPAGTRLVLGLPLSRQPLG